MRDPLNTKRTRRYVIGTVLTGRLVRTAADVATVAAQVAAGSLTSIDGATFGLFESAVADDSCSITSGAATLTSPNNPWTSADVGKAIDVQGAGAAGATLRSRIKAYTSAGSVDLWDAASTTVAAAVGSAGGLAIWGNDLNATAVLPKTTNEAGTLESAKATLAVLAANSAVARTMSARLAQVVDVLDYGIDPTGVVDTSPILQALIRLGNVDIVFPAGTFLVSSQIDPNGADNVTIRGQGASTVFKFAANYNGNAQRWINNTTLAHNDWTLRDFAFDGNESNMGAGEVTRDKIVKLKGDRFRMERTYWYNEAGRGVLTISGDKLWILNNGFNLIGCRTGGATYPSDCSILHPGQAAAPSTNVEVRGNVSLGDANASNQTTFIDAVVANDGVFADNIGYGDNQGMLLTWDAADCARVKIHGNQFTSLGYALRLYTSAAAGANTLKGVSIVNNDLSGSSCLTITGLSGDGTTQGVQDLRIANNRLWKSSITKTSGTPRGLSLNNAHIVQVVGNEVKGVDNEGIFIAGCDDVQVQGNDVHHCGTKGIAVGTTDNITIQANKVWNNGRTTDDTYAGIDIAATTTRLDILGNSSSDNGEDGAHRQKYGLFLSNVASIDTVGVVGNSFLGNSTGPYSGGSSILNLSKFNNRGMDDVYSASATWNPANLADGAGESKDFTVAEAVLGDRVEFFAPYDLQGILCTGAVKSAGVVTLRLQNETGGAIDLGSGSWRVFVKKFTA